MEIKEKDYTPGSMSWSDGFKGPKGDVGFQMKADYVKAKGILEQLIKDGRKITQATMGLDGDYEINSNVIFDGETHSDYNSHPSSQWAEPIMIVEFENELNECYSVWSK